MRRAHALGEGLILAVVLGLAGSARADDDVGGFSAASTSAAFGVVPQLLLGDTDSAPNRFSSFRLELHLDFGWYGAAGGGGRIEFPIARNGIINGVDDELALSLGAEVLYFYDFWTPGVGVYPLAAVQWNFFLTSAVSVFPELGIAFLFGPSRERYWSTFVAPFFGLGARFHFNARNAVLLRVSWPAGLQVGITF